MALRVAGWSDDPSKHVKPNTHAMSLTHEQVSALVKVVLLERSESLRLGGVTSAESGRGRVEVLIRLDGCHDAACVLSLNLNRTSRAQFEGDVNDELVHALNRHLSDPRRWHPVGRCSVSAWRIAPLPT